MKTKDNEKFTTKSIECHLIPRPSLILYPAVPAFLPITTSPVSKESWELAEMLLDNPAVLGVQLQRQTTEEWKEEGGDLPDEFRQDQGYVLRIAVAGITIATDTDAGWRYALHTLAQLVFQSQTIGQLAVLTIYDWPRMTTRCAHICYHLAQPWMPLSFPNHTALIGLIKRLAHFKINAVLMEIESLFPYQQHPGVSVPHAYSMDQIAEISRTCARWGVEIIPLLQCLGHAYHVLKLPQYAHLRETPDTLQQYCPSNPATREFYLEMVDELCRGFGTVHRFHLGGDESRRLGVCPDCSRTVALEGVGALYGNHIGAVAQALVERGITPLAWADGVEHHPEAFKYLPAEIELVHWKYSLRCPGIVIDFEQFGKHTVWAASGVRCGKSNHTMYCFQEVMQGIACLAAEAQRSGCEHWMVTDWMKAVPFELSEIGQAYAAEVGWYGGGRSLNEFTSAYTLVVHGTSMPQWWRICAALEPELPYCEDAQAHRYDLLDRHDYSGLAFRQRMEKNISANTEERVEVQRRLKKGLAEALSARQMMDTIQTSVIYQKHAWDVLSLSVDTHAHKARLGLALDDAACLLKYPLPDDLDRRRLLVEQFMHLVEEHDALRARTEKLLALESLAPNWKAVVNVKFEPAARSWMLYFADALRSGAPLPMLFGEEQVSVKLQGEYSFPEKEF